MSLILPGMEYVYPVGRVTSDNTVVDLVGWSARFIVENSDSNPILMITAVQSGSGVITLGGTQGTIALNIPASVIAGPSFIPAEYRLMMTSPGGITNCLLRGKFVKETR